MPEIVISEFMDPAAVAELAVDHELIYDACLVDRPTELVRLAQDCRALIVRNRTRVQRPLLDGCPRLRVVGRLGVGLDNIDLEACAARKIQVLPAIGANTSAVAEYVIAGLLMLFRGAYHQQRAMLAGEWPRQRLIGGEIGERRLGLIGFGSVAREVARRARALGMQIGAFDPYVPAEDPAWQDDMVKYTDLHELLTASDAVSLHVPLAAETRYLIDAEALATMKSTAVLINTARGGIVNDRALAAALRTGELGGAMLDVFEQEPLPADSFFEGVPNLILTPHIAGITEESNVRVSALIARNVRQALAETQ